MKGAERERARKPRAEDGLAIKLIAKRVGVSVGSVSRWVRDNGLALGEIERFWLERLELPSSCLRQAIVNNASSASKRKRRTLVYGTARVCVYSTFIVQSIFGAIQAYAGVDRPEWLDLP